MKAGGQGDDREDEMVGRHHRLDGQEFEQAPGVGDGQGSLACRSLWSRRESDMTEQLNWTELSIHTEAHTNINSVSMTHIYDGHYGSAEE